MLTAGLLRRKDSCPSTGRSKTQGSVTPRDVFSCLYRDAVRKQQAQEEAELMRPKNMFFRSAQLREYLPFDSLERKTSVSLLSEPRTKMAQSLLRMPCGSVKGSLCSGSTTFETNKRLDLLALPRGPANSIVVPRTPNYGRLINFTEEEEREKQERERRHFMRLHAQTRGMTRPTSDHATTRSAAPKCHKRSALLSR